MKQGTMSSARDLPFSTGTVKGQRLHAFHMVVLPLIPIMILLTQNVNSFVTNERNIAELSGVKEQINNAVDLATLARKLQEERMAVALNYFINRNDNLTDLEDVIKNSNLDIDENFVKKFRMRDTFKETDLALQAVKYWPKLSDDDFATKLKFTLTHAIFRNKINEGDKAFADALLWYNEVADKIIDYVVYSIHDTTIKDFYRWIIGYKNLLRAVEHAGKSGFFSLKYISMT